MIERHPEPHLCIRNSAQHLQGMSRAQLDYYKLLRRKCFSKDEALAMVGPPAGEKLTRASDAPAKKPRGGAVIDSTDPDRDAPHWTTYEARQKHRADRWHKRVTEWERELRQIASDWQNPQFCRHRVLAVLEDVLGELLNDPGNPHAYAEPMAGTRRAILRNAMARRVDA